MRVLLIEDDPNDMELASRELRRNGLSVLTCEDAEKGMQIARQEQPDLIICDVNLIGMHGYEFAKACKADPELRLVPLVAITGATLAEESRALSSGFDDLLIKPLKPDALSDAVGKLMERDRRSNLLFRMQIARRVGELEEGQRAQGDRIEGLQRYEEETRRIFVHELHNIHGDNQQKWTVVGEMLEASRKSQYLNSFMLVVLMIGMAVIAIALSL